MPNLNSFVFKVQKLKPCYVFQIQQKNSLPENVDPAVNYQLFFWVGSATEIYFLMEEKHDTDREKQSNKKALLRGPCIGEQT